MILVGDCPKCDGNLYVIYGVSGYQCVNGKVQRTITFQEIQQLARNGNKKAAAFLAAEDARISSMVKDLANRDYQKEPTYRYERINTVSDLLRMPGDYAPGSLFEPRIP